MGNIAGRFRQGLENSPPWTKQVYPENPAANAVIRNTAAILDSLGYEVKYLAGEEAEAKPKIHLKANFFASRTAWEAFLIRPELADVVREHIAYLARQAGGESEDGKAPDVRDVPDRLAANWLTVIKNLLRDLSPEEREELIYFFTVGSTNMDYRSMVMDGEVMVVLGGWQSLFGFFDFILLPGLCEWLETTEELDALLPPPGGFTRSMAGLMKLSL